MYGLDKKELAILRKLNTPSKIQSFLNKLPVNFEEHGETCMSPRRVLRNKKCHCIEGAFLAAACIAVNNLGKPIVVDMKGSRDDWDHVIAVFKKYGKWGAISKTNHAVLRYREPVYDSIRELIMSYFHEYTDSKNKGRKTLRSYSLPVNLFSSFGNKWMISEKNLWKIHDYLDKVRHFSILNKRQIRELRKADAIEIKAGALTEWKKR